MEGNGNVVDVHTYWQGEGFFFFFEDKYDYPRRLLHIKVENKPHVFQLEK